MRTLITGATGFIGRNLVQISADFGHDVIALSRSGLAVKGAESCIAWQLGQLPDLSDSAPIDVAVHLAHDFSAEDGGQKTIEGTIRLCAFLASLGVRRQIFVSSYSAGPHAKSSYGRTKSEIERRLLIEPWATIVRPGLVLGDAGIYGRIASWARRLPVVPLPDGGEGEVPVIDIDRLCIEIVHLSELKEAPRELNAFYPEFKSLRDLALAAALDVGRKPRILPVPSALLLSALRIGEAFSFKLPISSDSLLGFVSNQSADHQASLTEK